ncbi:MAG: NAD(P)/FAD-dependent oxidoreductase [Bacilli bacterium]
MFDIIIIGAGVSGIACALSIDKKYNTLLIDSNDMIGKKLSITGNGRCNITNSNYGNEFYDNIYNHKFMYSAFSNFDNFSLMELMQKYGVELKEEEYGRIFPTTNKAQTVIDALSKNLKHIQLNLNEEVLLIEENRDFEVITKKNKYKTKKIVIATGGLSYPQTGSTGFGLKYAKKIGHKITRLTACEAPLYTKDIICSSLQGVTLNNSALKYKKKSYSGFNLLITHFGLSGPLAFRQCFSIINEGISEIKIDFISNIKYEYLKDQLYNNTSIKKVLKNYLPKSVVDFLLEYTKIENLDFKKNSIKKQEELLTNIKNYPIKITKYADVSKGFTTAGGISTNEIDNKTFESKLKPNLYFIGEVLDVHAHTGGYNISTFFSMGINCGINL